jgi:GTPase SAR1 family protein
MAKKAPLVEQPEEEQVIDSVEEETEETDQDGTEENFTQDEAEQEALAAAEESFFGIWNAKTAAKKGFKVLLYGPSGAGKTSFAATFPSPLFLDLEGGLRSTVSIKDVMRFPKNPSKEVEDLKQVRQFYAQVRKAVDPPFKTIVVDSLNELQVLVTKEVLGTYDVNRMYDDQLTMQDYGKINRVFLNTVRQILKLPYHIVFTAVETPREYEGQEVYPKFVGKQIWPELQRMMEQIGYVHVRRGEGNEPEHVVSFMLSPTYVAKTRLKIKERFLPNHFSSLEKYLPKEEQI